MCACVCMCVCVGVCACLYICRLPLKMSKRGSVCESKQLNKNNVIPKNTPSTKPKKKNRKKKGANKNEENGS